MVVFKKELKRNKRFCRWLFDKFIGLLKTMTIYPKTFFDFCFENQSLYLKESIFITIGSFASILLHATTLGQKMQSPLRKWTSSSTISHSPPLFPCAREISHNFQRVGGDYIHVISLQGTGHFVVTQSLQFIWMHLSHTNECHLNCFQGGRYCWGTEHLGILQIGGLCLPTPCVGSLTGPPYDFISVEIPRIGSTLH